MSDTESEPPRPELSVTEMRSVIATILDVLECPVCYQELHSPIYQCNNGHTVCASCRPRVRACPVCKSWMYHVRALALEKILGELPRPCRYAAAGCPVRVGAAGRARHERSCPLRPARCVELLVTCPWTGPVAQLREHLAESHHLADRLHCGLRGRFGFRVGCLSQEKFLEEPGGGLLFRCLIRKERGGLHFLCHALAPVERAAQYVFRVLVIHRCSERRVSYEGPVVSVFQSLVKTIESSQGLRVGRDWLHNACGCPKFNACFDTTWQLSRKEEMIENEAMLRSIFGPQHEAPLDGEFDEELAVVRPQGERSAETRQGQQGGAGEQAQRSEEAVGSQVSGANEGGGTHDQTAGEGGSGSGDGTQGEASGHQDVEADDVNRAQAGAQAGARAGAQADTQAGVQDGLQAGTQVSAQDIIQNRAQAGAQAGAQAETQDGAQDDQEETETTDNETDGELSCDTCSEYLSEESSDVSIDGSIEQPGQ